MFAIECTQLHIWDPDPAKNLIQKTISNPFHHERTFHYTLMFWTKQNRVNLIIMKDSICSIEKFKDLLGYTDLATKSCSVDMTIDFVWTRQVVHHAFSKCFHLDLLSKPPIQINICNPIPDPRQIKQCYVFSYTDAY